MILNDEEIKDLDPREIIPGVDDYILILKDSHIEANAELRKARERIRELENENEGLRSCQEALYNELFPEEQEDEREVRWKWMTLRVEEMRDRISFLEDISSREFWAASRKIAEFQGRADRTEAKLRELVEAAEWRDELVCFYTTQRTDKIRNKNGWWDRFDYENCRKADAKVTYQDALKAAKG